MNANIERSALLDHGTKAIVLTPSSIVDAAREDLRRHDRNAAAATKDAEYEHYAFHRRHVAKAVKKNPHPRSIIELALAELALGQESGKHWTRVIYSDAELLKKALEAA